jgi:hypothetical protein
MKISIPNTCLLEKDQGSKSVNIIFIAIEFVRCNGTYGLWCSHLNDLRLSDLFKDCVIYPNACWSWTHLVVRHYIIVGRVLF